MNKKSGAAARREGIRTEFFPKEDLWRSDKEIGWFAMSRTLPLIMSLLSSKQLSGNKNPSSVYLELLSRHRGEGIIEMSAESEHAFAAGYQGPRAVRTWQERMQTLQKLGFIRTHQVGNERYKHVALIHPTTAVQQLRNSKKIPDNWWAAYITRKLETKEPTHDVRQQELKQSANVVPIKTAKSSGTFPG